MTRSPYKDYDIFWMCEALCSEQGWVGVADGQLIYDARNHEDNLISVQDYANIWGGVRDIIVSLSSNLDTSWSSAQSAWALERKYSPNPIQAGPNMRRVVIGPGGHPWPQASMVGRFLARLPGIMAASGYVPGLETQIQTRTAHSRIHLAAAWAKFGPLVPERTRLLLRIA